MEIKEETKQNIIVFVLIVFLAASLVAIKACRHNQCYDKGMYLDVPCPICNSNEVIDLGDDRGVCPDCGCDFEVLSASEVNN